MRDDDPLKYFPGYAEACACTDRNNLVPEPARPTSAESASTDMVLDLAKRWDRRLAESSGATRDALDCGRTLQLRECCDELRAELGKIQSA